MVAETGLILMFCFQEHGQESRGQGAGEAVLMERKKWKKTRVKDASRIDNKGFVDIK